MVIDSKILEQLPIREQKSHKGMFGKILCVAGSRDMAGAAYLCTHAAYRAGAGLVRTLTPEENRVVLQVKIPEAVLSTFDREAPDYRKLFEALSWADAAAIGPGLGKEDWAVEFVHLTMERFHKPLVVDADGLNLLSVHREWLKEHEGPLILTPHVGEFSRLSGLSAEEIKDQVPQCAADFAKKHHCICVLKDAPTAVGDGTGQFYINTTGNNGMSTGGSGDVLTGIIAGLLGQGAKPLSAALLGVWLHGRAGDLAVQREGSHGLMARHLIEYLPGAFSTDG